MNVNRISTGSSSEPISIDFSSRDASASKQAVREAKDGKVTTNEITDISDESTRLKEMDCNTKEINTPKLTSISVETDQTSFKEHMEKSLGEKEEAQAAEKDIAKKKESLEDVASRITAADYEDLMLEGDILKAYEVIRLEEALSRVKEQRADKEQGIEKQVETKKEDQEQIVQVAIKSKSAKAGSEEIAKKLEEANLPVTESNLAKIAAAMELADHLNPMSDKEMGYLLENEEAPTIANLYKATYSSAQGGRPAVDTAVIDGLNEQIDTAIEGFGMEVDPKTHDQAVWLLKQDLPVTKENMVRLGQLERVNESLEQGSKEEILDQIIQAVANGTAPKEANLYDPKASVQGAIEILSNATDPVIRKAVEYQIPVTLRTLGKAATELKETGTVQSDQISQKATPADKGTPEDIAIITVRRQLEEIRLKMTTEAGAKLYNKGFQIETEELAKVVDALKEQEDAYYRNLLKEANVVDSLENMEAVKSATAAIEDIKTVPSYIIGTVQKDWATLTMGTLHAEGMAQKAQLDKANATYDALMTQPRKDLGDSMQKAFESTDAMLKELNLESTEANRRAVKILGYNQMEITSESILAVKTRDLQLNTLVKELHPAVVVDMIRDGVNPLDTQIDQLTKLVQERKQELGITEDEKYSQFLWKLEKEDGITPEERKSFVGIYRLLNNVEKTDGAALGALVKTGQEVTLNHLLGAVRTIRSGGLDVKVDDTFGALESVQYASETITSQIEAGYQQKADAGADQNQENIALQVTYMEQLLNGIMEELSPAKLNHVKDQFAQKGGLMEAPIEAVAEEMATVPKEETAPVYEETLQMLRESAKNPEESMRLLQQMNLPATVQNIVTAGAYLNQPQNLFRQIRQLDEELSADLSSLEDGLTDADTMEEAYARLESTVQKAMGAKLESPDLTSADLTQLKNLRTGMNFITKLSHSRSYEIPILVGESITNINLTLVTGTKDAGKIDMKVRSEALGSIEANFSVRGMELKGMIVSDNRQGLDLLKENREQLAEALSGTDLTVRQMDYGIYKAKQANTAPNLSAEDGVATSALYRVAKVLVTHIKELEGQIQ